MFNPQRVHRQPVPTRTYAAPQNSARTWYALSALSGNRRLAQQHQAETDEPTQAQQGSEQNPAGKAASSAESSRE